MNTVSMVVPCAASSPSSTKREFEQAWRILRQGGLATICRPPCADRLAALERRPVEDEHAVVDVQFVNRVGEAMVGAQRMLEDEAAKLEVITFADEAAAR